MRVAHPPTATMSVGAWHEPTMRRVPKLVDRQRFPENVTIASDFTPEILPDVYTDAKERPMKYKIAIRRSDEGISVFVPALPGCWSEGDTEEEALAKIQDAIREYLAALEDRFQDAEVREAEVVG